jgi:putative transcriptional regulator
LKSDAFEAIHSSASALHKVGAIDKATMRDFDAACLAVPLSMEPRQIKKLRESNHVSQPVFARFLNTSESTVEKRRQVPSDRAVWLSSYWPSYKSTDCEC